MFPWFEDILAGVPAYDRYPPLAEVEESTDRLAASHPEVAVWSPGASRGGRSLRCVQIPGGAHEALLVGMPHPAEPVGALVLEYLLPLLADGLAEELGFSFSVVEVADPDAARLNEPWPGEPRDLAGFLLRACRPTAVSRWRRTCASSAPASTGTSTSSMTTSITRPTAPTRSWC